MTSKNSGLYGWFWDGEKFYWLQDDWDKEHGYQPEPLTEVCIDYYGNGAWKHGPTYILNDRVRIDGNGVWLKANDPILTETGCLKGMKLDEVRSTVYNYCHAQWMKDSDSKIGV